MERFVRRDPLHIDLRDLMNLLREMSLLPASCPTTFSNEFPKYKRQVEGQGLSNLAGDIPNWWLAGWSTG